MVVVLSTWIMTTLSLEVLAQLATECYVGKNEESLHEGMGIADELAQVSE